MCLYCTPESDHIGEKCCVLLNIICSTFLFLLKLIIEQGYVLPFFYGMLEHGVHAWQIIDSQFKM
jgi:hypothetical protein